MKKISIIVISSVLSVILSLIFLSGCDFNKNKTTIENEGTTGVVLMKLLINTNLQTSYDKVYMLDETYQVVSKNWLEQAVIPTFNEHLSYVGITKYKSEISDCDKYSKSFVEHANKILRKTSNANHAVAIGLVSYVTKFNGIYNAHQINIIICNDEILFFEPQYNKFIELTEQEILSITRIIF